MLRNALIVLAVLTPLAIAANWWQDRADHVITFATDPAAFAGAGGSTGGPDGPIVLPALPKLARSAIGSQQLDGFIGQPLLAVRQALGLDADAVAGSAERGWVVVFYAAVAIEPPAEGQWPVAHVRLEVGKAAHPDQGTVTGVQLLGTLGSTVGLRL